MSAAFDQLYLQLFNIKAIKFGSFKLKSGVQSPVYVDLRVLVSFPSLLNSVAELMWNKINGSSFDLICGVPYTALPIATCMSVTHNIPMIMRRKEAKSYGTKQMLEGCYEEGQTVLVIEDVISSGTSIFETVLCLQRSGLKVTDAVVLLNREQKGINNLSKYGITVHSVLTVSDMLESLVRMNLIEKEEAKKTIDWLHASNAPLTDAIVHEYLILHGKYKTLSFSERSALCKHNLSKRLLNLMSAKRTNVCVAIDYTCSKDVLELAEAIGPFVAVVKIHVDVLTDFGYDSFVKPLLELSVKHNFCVFEDRKFADIGNTAKKQYSDGIYKISDWADLVTVHTIVGPSIIKSLKSGCKNVQEKGCLLIAEMSCEGNLLNKSTIEAAFATAKANEDFVIGFISQSHVTTEPDKLHFTPGVSIDSTGDHLGQRYNSPEDAILNKGADIIIVGRGVTEATDTVAAIEEYRRRAFAAYELKVASQAKNVS